MLVGGGLDGGEVEQEEVKGSVACSSGVDAVSVELVNGCWVSPFEANCDGWIQLPAPPRPVCKYSGGGCVAAIAAVRSVVETGVL